MCISIHVVVISVHLGKLPGTFYLGLVVTLIKESSRARLGIITLIPIFRLNSSVWVGLKPRLFSIESRSERRRFIIRAVSPVNIRF